jgi:hypothetical protein
MVAWVYLISPLLREASNQITLGDKSVCIVDQQNIKKSKERDKVAIL